MSEERQNERSAYRVRDGRGIGHALRHFRNTAGLTQVQIAERTGIPREYIVAMEGGLETEQVRRLFHLLRMLDLDLVIRRATD